VSPGRIGIFAHSTNPRGGVVHALHLAEALCDAGREATLLAPTLPGGDLFRAPRCRFIPIPARPVVGVAAMVAQRIAEIGAFLRQPGAPRFDIYHAQDPISANALADLTSAGVIGGFVRTAHHLDTYTDPRLAAWQDRAVIEAAQLCCVSDLWQARLWQRYGRTATNVGNGVDLARFGQSSDTADLRARLGLPPKLATGRVLLVIGGIEARKNTLNVLRAFQLLYAARSDVRLLIAGGATLLDHGAERARFAEAFAATQAADAVHLAGIIADADMPALYRLADALVYASRDEGFGLCPLEAMAAGRPVILSARPPFTEHFTAADAVFTDPDDPAAIADAMHQALDKEVAERLGRRGPGIAGRFGWDRVAASHMPIYDAFAKQEHLNA
jgi:glycosyltransferase-like protein